MSSGDAPAFVDLPEAAAGEPGPLEAARLRYLLDLDYRYEVLSDFAAEEPEQLTLQRGESLQLVLKASAEWWLMARGQEGESDHPADEGLVPSSFVQLRCKFAEYAVGPTEDLLTTALLLPTGAVTTREGEILYPDGSVEEADGTVVLPNGVVLARDVVQSPQLEAMGAVRLSDGVVVLPDGNLMFPSGAVLRPENQLESEDGKLFSPDWSVPVANFQRESGGGEDGEAMALQVSALPRNLVDLDLYYEASFDFTGLLQSFHT
jgi:hypothetical protein